MLPYAEHGHDDDSQHHEKEDEQARVLHSKEMVLFGGKLVEVVIGHRILLLLLLHSASWTRNFCSRYTALSLRKAVLRRDRQGRPQHQPQL